MFTSRLETQVCLNGGLILAKSVSKAQYEKRGKADDIKDDIISRHNVILVLQLTSDFVPKTYLNNSMIILNHYFTSCSDVLMS